MAAMSTDSPSTSSVSAAFPGNAVPSFEMYIIFSLILVVLGVVLVVCHILARRSRAKRDEANNAPDNLTETIALTDIENQASGTSPHRSLPRSPTRTQGAMLSPVFPHPDSPMFWQSRPSVSTQNSDSPTLSSSMVPEIPRAPSPVRLPGDGALKIICVGFNDTARTVDLAGVEEVPVTRPGRRLVYSQ